VTNAPRAVDRFGDGHPRPRAGRAGLCAVAAALVVACWSAPGRADDEADARAAMMRGIAAFGRGQADVAIAEYETAKKLAPDANAPYRYAAEAFVALGRYREAVDNLEAYLRKNASVSDAQEVRAKIVTIKASFYPARLVVRADAPGAAVRIDDEAKGPPGAIEIQPGKHHVEVRAPGYASATQEIVLVGDRDATLVLTLNPAEAKGPTQPVAPSRTNPTEPTPWQTIGWLGVGVGGAAVVTGIVLDLAVLGPKIAAYDAAAANGDPAARDLRDSANGLQTATLATYLAGGVLAAAGAALLLFAPKESLRGARIVPAIGPGHAGVVTQITF
jgi:tetratricopeptide (TPR) repeat protein